MNGDETIGPENLVAAAIEAAEDIRDPLEGSSRRPRPIPARPLRPIL